MPTYTTTSASGEVDLRMEKEGPGAWAPRTVYQIFEETVQRYGDRPALHYKQVPHGGSPQTTEWSIHTWREYYDLTITFAKSLLALDFPVHGAINIIGFNSPEWLIANCGAIAAGGVAVGIYTSNNTEACNYITEHSEAEVVVVENAKQLEKYVKIAKDLPRLKALVVYDGTGEGFTCDTPIYSWKAFMALGNKVDDAAVRARIEAQRPGHCCTLIYTSGTTGPPKAVMISHDNLPWTVKNFVAALPFTLTCEDRSVSYLPLSHVAAQMLDVHCPIATGAKIYFAQADALRGSLPNTLKDVCPTYFFGVPRVWEKIYEKMQEVSRSTKGVKRALAQWAKAKGLEKNRRQQYGGGGGAPMGFGCAYALILSKVKAALGLHQTKICITSAAPISVDVLEYFASLDIPVLELFGQSECTGPHTSNFSYAWKIGSIGRDIPGVKSKQDAAMKEFCMFGRHIMMGYMKMEEKTKEAVDEEGWLHSGDVADMDADGFWTITGRIKELIITAGGENIPPVLIENEVKAALPAVANCMVVGDKKKFLTVLLTLKTKLDEQGNPTNALNREALDIGKELGSAATTTEQVAKDPAWKKYIEEGLKKANAAATSNAQFVQKWTVLSLDFSEKGGELTPTLKLKRSVVTEKYADVIAGLYKE